MPDINVVTQPSTRFSGLMGAFTVHEVLHKARRRRAASATHKKKRRRTDKLPLAYSADDSTAAAAAAAGGTTGATSSSGVKSFKQSDSLAPYSGFILTETQYDAFPLGVFTAVEAPYISRYDDVSYVIVGHPEHSAVQANHDEFTRANAKFAWHLDAIQYPQPNQEGKRMHKRALASLGTVFDHHLYLQPRRGIKAAHEILLNYGDDFWTNIVAVCAVCLLKSDAYNSRSCAPSQYGRGRFIKCSARGCRVMLGYHADCYDLQPSTPSAKSTAGAGVRGPSSRWEELLCPFHATQTASTASSGPSTQAASFGSGSESDTDTEESGSRHLLLRRDTVMRAPRALSSLLGGMETNGTGAAAAASFRPTAASSHRGVLAASPRIDLARIAMSQVAICLRPPLVTPILHPLHGQRNTEADRTLFVSCSRGMLQYGRDYEVRVVKELCVMGAPVELGVFLMRTGGVLSGTRLMLYGGLWHASSWFDSPSGRIAAAAIPSLKSHSIRVKSSSDVLDGKPVSMMYRRPIISGSLTAAAAAAIPASALLPTDRECSSAAMAALQEDPQGHMVNAAGPAGQGNAAYHWISVRDRTCEIPMLVATCDISPGDQIIVAKYGQPVTQEFKALFPVADRSRPSDTRGAYPPDATPPPDLTRVTMTNIVLRHPPPNSRRALADRMSTAAKGTQQHSTAAATAAAAAAAAAAFASCPSVLRAKRTAETRAAAAALHEQREADEAIRTVQTFEALAATAAAAALPASNLPHPLMSTTAGELAISSTSSSLQPVSRSSPFPPTSSNLVSAAHPSRPLSPTLSAGASNKLSMRRRIRAPTFSPLMVDDRSSDSDADASNLSVSPADAEYEDVSEPDQLQPVPTARKPPISGQPDPHTVKRDLFKEYYETCPDNWFAALRLFRDDHSSLKAPRPAGAATPSAANTVGVSRRIQAALHSGGGRRTNKSKKVGVRLSIDEQWVEEQLFVSAAQLTELYAAYKSMIACCLARPSGSMDNGEFLQAPVRSFPGFFTHRLKNALLPLPERQQQRLKMLDRFKLLKDRDQQLTFTNTALFLNTFDGISTCPRCSYTIHGVGERTFLRDRQIAFGLVQPAQKAPREFKQRDKMVQALRTAIACEGEMHPAKKGVVKFPGAHQQKLVCERLQQNICAITGDEKPPSASTYARAKKACGIVVTCVERTMLGKCRVCTALDNLLREKDLTPTQRRAAVDARELHLKQQQAQRFQSYMFGATSQTADADSWHLAIDGMDQSKTNVPHPSRALKQELGQLTVKLLGVHVEGGPIPAMAFLCLQDLRGDGNLNCEVVQRALQVSFDALAKTGGSRPKHLRISMDNATGSNKNAAFFNYLTLLVNQHHFDTVHTVFYLPGHGHCKLDQMFSRFSYRLKHVPAYSLEQLQRQLKDAYQPTRKTAEQASAAIDALNKGSTLSEETVLPGMRCGRGRSATQLDSEGCPAEFLSFAELMHHQRQCVHVDASAASPDLSGLCFSCNAQFADTSLVRFQDPNEIAHAASAHRKQCNSYNDEVASILQQYDGATNATTGSTATAVVDAPAADASDAPELYTEVVMSVADVRSWLLPHVKQWSGITKVYEILIDRSPHTEWTRIRYRRLQVQGDRGVSHDADGMEDMITDLDVLRPGFYPQGEPSRLPPLRLDLTAPPPTKGRVAATGELTKYEARLRDLYASKLGVSLGLHASGDRMNQWPSVFSADWGSATDDWRRLFREWAQRDVNGCDQCSNLRHAITSDDSKSKGAAARFTEHQSGCAFAKSHSWWWRNYDTRETRLHRDPKYADEQRTKMDKAQGLIDSVRQSIHGTNDGDVLLTFNKSKDRFDRTQPVKKDMFFTSFGTDTSAPYAVGKILRVHSGGMVTVQWWDSHIDLAVYHRFVKAANEYWVKTAKLHAKDADVSTAAAAASTSSLSLHASSGGHQA